jgi:hypothetical protein
MLAAFGLAVIVAACGYVGIWIYTEAEETLGVYDSDLQEVPPVFVSDKLELWLGVPLPARVGDMKVVFMGGVDPSLFLRFETCVEDMDRFADGVLSSRIMQGAKQSTGTAFPGWVAEMANRKHWWVPRPDLPWWHSQASGADCFLQPDYENRRIYFAIWLY